MGAEYKRAFELDPNNAAAHLGLATWLLCQGRTEEALAWSRRARELDPLGDSGVGIGWILFHARHYDEAIRELRSVLAVRPDSAIAHWFLGFALIADGRSEEAIPELEKTASIMDRSPGALELLATAYARAGRRTQALRVLDELSDASRRAMFQRALLLTLTWHSATTTRRLWGLSEPTRKGQTFCYSLKYTRSLIPCGTTRVLRTCSAASGLIKRGAHIISQLDVSRAPAMLASLLYTISDSN